MGDATEWVYSPASVDEGDLAFRNGSVTAAHQDWILPFVTRIPAEAYARDIMSRRGARRAVVIRLTCPTKTLSKFHRQ